MNFELIAIYCIQNNINGKRYIGQTNRRRVLERWNEHKKAASKCSRRTIYSAIRKYGYNAFTITVLAWSLDRFYANYLEQFYIAKFDTFKHGYNETIGGGGVSGRKANAKQREALAAGARRSWLVHKGRKLSPEQNAALHAHMHLPGYKGTMAGRKHSKEALENITQANRKIIRPPDIGERISKGKKGKSSVAVLKGWETRRRKQQEKENK